MQADLNELHGRDHDAEHDGGMSTALQGVLAAVGGLASVSAVMAAVVFGARAAAHRVLGDDDGT